jgi:hypothetical protein
MLKAEEESVGFIMKKSNNDSCLAVIAGSGKLPSLLISYLKQSNRSFVVIGLDGNASPSIARGTNHIFVRLGELGKALAFLKQNQVKELVFAGKLQRPSLASIKPDMKGIAFLGKLGLGILKSGAGDDKILSQLIKLLEGQGFKVIGPEKLLPSLLTPPGVLSKLKPTKQDLQDIKLGKSVLSAISPSDVGQAVIVENSYVLGIEAAEGTDNLILRCGKLRKEKTRSGILIKMKKAGQETRIDLPSIGVQTIESAHKAGLKGLALEAKHSLIIDLDAVIKRANELKLFLIGI